MSKIRVLPEILASQVAAGEVVERPASVVKELVENSIDAGAREIRVDTDQGGTALIRVSDDGCGMSRDDALMSLERHATSKLRSAVDLAAIRTLGFRGEAVPSIASVSKFRMTTREAGAIAGTEISVDGGKLRDVREAGCAPGTVIEARALFFNVPARRKFLRAESTESAHIEHQLRLHALAAPQIRFRLRRDERDVFDLAPASKAVDRIRQLIGSNVGRDLIALPTTQGRGISLEGYVLPASHARKGRRHQMVFLNGRPVEEALISRALAEGFRGAIADGSYPAAWLWIQIDPQLVDVNVHPAKREVRLHRPMDLRETIINALAAGLCVPGAVTVTKSHVVSNFKPNGDRDLSKPAEPVAQFPSPANLRPAQPSLSNWSTPSRTPEQSATPSATGSQKPDFRILGLLHHRYIIMEGEEGLVLLDPRAARERILYEKMMSGDAQNNLSQPLLLPLIIELDPRDFDLLLRERTTMAEAGIEVESFGGNSIQVRSLPAGLDFEQPREMIGKLLDELLHGPVSGTRFTRERLARIMATRAALATEAKLEEAHKLLDQLFRCELPYCTASGRPTLTQFGIGELDRRFGNPKI
ncbi:MAG: DNA mismatch repair endonuclease MutL [Luteolibacter sp.]